MSLNPEQALRSAVERGTPAVLSLPVDAGLRNSKSRFLGRNERGIWVEADSFERPLIESLIAARQIVGVTSKHQFEKLQFVAPILQINQKYTLSATSHVFAVLLGEPSRITLSQRRNDYRARVLERHGISAQVWQIPEQVYIGDRPSAKQLLRCDVCDISIGGLGIVIFPKDNCPAEVKQGDRLRVLLAVPGDEILLEARISHSSLETDTNTLCGVEFQNLQRDVEGRQKLAKLDKVLAELQRDEVKRCKATEAA